MSMNTAAIGTASNPQPAEVEPRVVAHSTPTEAQAPSEPNPGNAPKQEIRAPEPNTSDLEMPQDEVQVQRDSASAGEIVIKYMDHAGRVILQVPSDQVLGIARATQQEFEKADKARAVDAPSDIEGGISHGH